MIDLPVYDPDNWQNRAQCYTRGVDPALMQPDAATRAEVEEAKAVCVGCPVLAECRRHAEDQADGVPDSLREAYGVHAGEWFGPNPLWMAEGVCVECDGPFRAREKSGREAPKFCGDLCRGRWWAREKRARKAVAV